MHVPVLHCHRKSHAALFALAFEFFYGVNTQRSKVSVKIRTGSITVASGQRALLHSIVRAGVGVATKSNL